MGWQGLACILTLYILYERFELCELNWSVWRLLPYFANQNCQFVLIRGEYSIVEGLNFHKTCFVCSAPNCQGSLDTGFLVDGGKAYCISCHNKYFSEPCVKCGGPIFEVSVISSTKVNWVRAWRCFGKLWLENSAFGKSNNMKPSKIHKWHNSHKRAFSERKPSTGTQFHPWDPQLCESRRPACFLRDFTSAFVK